VSQNYARKWHIPIDKLDFEYDILTAEGNDKLPQPSEGAYIYVRVGCFLSMKPVSKQTRLVASMLYLQTRHSDQCAAWILTWHCMQILLNSINFWITNKIEALVVVAIVRYFVNWAIGCTRKNDQFGILSAFT